MVILVVIILLIAGAFSFLYWKYERPAIVQEENNFRASIYAIDVQTQDRIVTNYSIYVGGSLTESGKTLEKGPIVHKFEAGSSVLVKSNDSSYYNDEIFANPDIVNLSRIELRLVNPSELIIEQHGTFLLDEKITFNLSTEREFRNLIVCTEWTNNFIYVKSNYPKSEEKPREFDKCFETGQTLNKDDEISFILDYKVFGFLTEKDFIRLYFMDSENGLKDYSLEEDKWSEDKEIILNINNI